ncbi:MAG: transketolase [Gammaproteobacteria bacterium]|jgi:transketolase|nr:transketolase [Gammaproteobacteria bacterium]
MPDTVQFAQNVRRNIIHMTHRGNSSHVASALSITDILAVLYKKIMRIDPQQPNWEERDRFILSKGHAGAAVYATLAERGFFDPKRLEEHCKNGGYLSGHVSHKNVPGVELSTGSLGHGLSVGAGIAYATKIENGTERTFVLMSDGECGEGSNWEAILFAGHHQLNRLVAVIDYNKLQSLGSVASTLNLEPLKQKLEAFAWTALEVDGHNHEELARALTDHPTRTQPLCIIAHTTKGKGVSFMENQVLWHYRSPQNADYTQALKDLGAAS